MLPGGFAYGDYLRAGAMAALSPVMGAVKRHAEAGGLVLGICNGFQVLLEAGLLPGAMRRNQNLRFLCRDVYLRVERDRPAVHPASCGGAGAAPADRPRRGELRGFARARSTRLEADGQVVFRYCDAGGRASTRSAVEPQRRGARHRRRLQRRAATSSA